MRQKIKDLLGDVMVYRLRSMKNRVFPNAFYIKEKKEIGLRKAFYRQFVGKNDLCFDVGANLGNRVSPLLQIGARVVAVEPQEICQKILKIKFGDKIRIVPKGLGEKEEVKEFYISDASYLSSFSKTWIDSVKKERFKENTWNSVQKVQMTTLDKLIETYGLPAFIKIDVEGYELEVLMGLNVPVGMISFEYTTPELTERAVNCLKRIQSVSPDIECNYSVGESMEFALDAFISAGEMLSFIGSDKFIETGFGDLYIRRKSEGQANK